MVSEEQSPRWISGLVSPVTASACGTQIIITIGEQPPVLDLTWHNRTDIVSASLHTKLAGPEISSAPFTDKETKAWSRGHVSSVPSPAGQSSLL